MCTHFKSLLRSHLLVRHWPKQATWPSLQSVAGIYSLPPECAPGRGEWRLENKHLFNCNPNNYTPLDPNVPWT